MKRELRISAYKDYIAVDVVDSKGKIIDTPFYLGCKSMGKLKYKDSGEIFLCSVFMADNDKSFLLARDSTGFDFEIPYSELLDETIIKFIKS